MDIQNADNSSRCLPSDPCFPANKFEGAPSRTSRQFDSGYFKMSFQALMNGSPITVTDAGLNQQQTHTDSFFDVYFDIDLGNGISQEGALGIDVTPPSPVTPVVTGPGAIGWTTVPPSPIRQSTFELDPMAFENFDIILQTALTLPNDPPPPFTPNPNVVPEPSSVLLLATVAAGLLIASRRSMKKLSNEF